MSLLQSVAQLAAEHPTPIWVSVGAGAGSVLLLGVKAMASRVIKAFDSLADDVKAFQHRIHSHEQEDDRRFRDAVDSTNQMRTELLTAINKHSNNMQSAVTAIQIEFAEVKARLPERREKER